MPSSAGVAAATEVIPSLPEERPVSGTDERVGVHRCAAWPEVDRRVETSERQRESDEQEANEAKAEDGEVRAHHVSCVLLLRETGFDQREAGLHEDHQHGADDHPQQVDLESEVRDGIGVLGKSDTWSEHGERARAGSGAENSKRMFAHESSFEGM